MPAFKSQQRRLIIHGRAFHFVSYEGEPVPRGADAAAQPKPPMWFLMVEGHRCPVCICDAEQSLEEVDAALVAWVGDNALIPVDPATSSPAGRHAGRRQASSPEK